MRRISAGFGAQFRESRFDEVVLGVAQLVEGGRVHLVSEHVGIGQEVAGPAFLGVAGLPGPRRLGVRQGQERLAQAVTGAHAGAELLDVDLTTNIGVLVCASRRSAARPFQFACVTGGTNRTRTLVALGEGLLVGHVASWISL